MSAKPTTVLIVEDAEDIREFFAVSLQDAGYRVVCAASVREALGHLRAGTPAEVVVVDYSLPDGTGAELIHQARNEGHFDPKTTRTLICTAYRYVELPPYVQILHKPLTPLELVQAVRQPPGTAEVA
jgi:CheY-like chemotaxis protein